MISIISFFILFGLGSILVVGIGIAIQLSRSNNRKNKEADNDENDLASKHKNVVVEQLLKWTPEGQI